MININRDTIATYARRFIFDDTDAAFLDSFNSMTDDCPNLESRIDAFADLSITELRDDLDAAIDTFCPSTATDDDLERFTLIYFDALRTDRDFIADAIADALRIRLNRILT